MGDEGKGGERTMPTDDELQEMKRMVAEAMEDGAFGMTTGLVYAPGRNASTEEVVELCKIVAGYGGVYLSHIRGEGETLIEATKELIGICERAGVPGCLGHYKASGRANWGKPTESMRLIDEAWARGVEIYCDFYPWTYSNGQSLGMGIVRGHFASLERLETLTREGLLQELKNQDGWEKIRKEYMESQKRNAEKNEERRIELAKRGIKIPKAEDPRESIHLAYSKTRPDLVWKSLGEIAEALGLADYLEAMRKLYIADQGFTYFVGGCMNEEDLITILRHPMSSPSTDADTWDLSKASFSYGVEERLRWNHPRGWGSYPIILQKYVREMRIIRLEEAVRKMTSLPAQFLGLQDRGIIKEGMWADVVVFDPEKIACRATYAYPTQYPDGIPYVIVNGQIAIDEGKRTEALPGQVLFHKG